MSTTVSVSLPDLCAVVTDGTHDSPKLLSAGVPFIKGKHISGGTIAFDDCDFISEDDHARCIRRVKPQANDVLFSNIGSVGDAARVIDERDFSIKNVALFRPDPVKVDPTYFYYLVVSPLFRGAFLNITAGAAQQFLSLEILRQHRFPCVRDKRVQQRIGEVLSAYDDLIENNTRRIALLEKAARLLYEEWFVRLRFPGREHTRVVDGVPQGWKRTALGDITTKIRSGFTPRGGDSAYATEGTSLIRSMNVYDDQFQEQGLAFLDEQQAADLAGVAVEPQDILLNITGASVARCCMAPERHLPARVNQHVMIIRVDAEKADAFFVHKAINSDERKRQLLSYAQKGSTREALTKEMIANFEVTLPPDSLMRQFGEFAGLSFKQCENLALQNQKARAARDLLLPRLMSGEIAA